jgi:hypothetical protein
VSEKTATLILPQSTPTALGHWQVQKKLGDRPSCCD